MNLPLTSAAEGVVPKGAVPRRGSPASAAGKPGGGRIEDVTRTDHSVLRRRNSSHRVRAHVGYRGEATAPLPRTSPPDGIQGHGRGDRLRVPRRRGRPYAVPRGAIPGTGRPANNSGKHL